MKSMTSLLAIGMLVGANAAAQTYRVPITDPTEIESMGLPADTRNVFRLVDADATESPRDLEPDGGVDPAYTHSSTVTAEDFVLTSSLADYDIAAFSQLYCPTGATNRIASATLNLPSDRRLQYLDVWGKDDLTSEVINVYLYETCQSQSGPPDPSNTLLAQVNSPDTAELDFASYDTIPANTYTDNLLCTYTINAVLGSDACDGSLLKLYKVRVVYEAR